MAASRYRNLISVQSNYVPEEYTPNFGAYADILKQQQTAFDTMGALGEKVPQHLQQDYEDVTKYLGDVRSKIDSIADIYDKQGVSAGNRQRKALLREVGREWQPGGKADRFQQRLNTYSAQKKQLEETYKDDPRIAQYYINKIGVSPYSDNTAPNYGISSPTTYKIYNDEELNDYYDKALGNISADQVVSAPQLDKSTLRGVSFKDLLVSGNTKYIDWNKVASTLAGITTPQIQASEEVRGEAYGQGSGQSSIFKLDKEGKPVFDEKGNVEFADSALGRRLQGYTTGKVFSEQDMKTTVVEDVFARQRALKQAEEENAFSNIMLTQPFNINTQDSAFGGAKSGIVIEGSDIILKGSAKEREQKFRDSLGSITDYIQRKDIPLMNAGVGGYIRNNVASYFKQLFGPDDKMSLKDANLERTFSILEQKRMVKSGATPEQKVEALGNSISYFIKNNTDQAQVTPLLGITTESKKYADGIQKAIFGDQTKGSFGIISNLNVYDDEGERVDTQKLQEDIEKSGKTAKLEGEVRAPESLLPFGSRIFQVGDKEYRVEPLLSDKSRPEYFLNMAYRAQADLLNNFEVEEELPGLKPGINYGGLEKYIQGPGTYKMQYNPEGYNIFRKTRTGYEKLNDEYIEF